MAHLKQCRKVQNCDCKKCVCLSMHKKVERERELKGEQSTHKVWPTQDELYTSEYLANLIQENYRGR